MARENALTCRQAQAWLQTRLDHRWTHPMPGRLQRHVESCPHCAPWLTLLAYEPSEPFPPLPEGFSRNVVHAVLHRSRRNRSWQGLSRWAAAAAILIALLGSWWFDGPKQGQRPNAVAQVHAKRPDLDSLVVSVKQEWDTIPDRVQQFQSTSINLLALLPEMDFEFSPDPWSESLPVIKSIGGTLQGAVQPLETPAKEAYQKVKMLIDDASMRKWLSSLSRGAV
jgi:hypothetical protein